MKHRQKILLNIGAQKYKAIVLLCVSVHPSVCVSA